MPGEHLGAAGDREVGTQLQRALPERGRQGVVDRDEGALRVGRRDEASYVADVEPRVRRGLDPQQLRAVEHLELGVAAGRGGAYLDAVRGELLAHQWQHLVAVDGQDHHVSGLQLGEEHRRDGGHPGGEGERRDTVLPGCLQLADGTLQERPGRVLVTTVGVRAGRIARQMEVRGEDRARKRRLVFDGVGQPRPYRSRAVAASRDEIP